MHEYIVKFYLKALTGVGKGDIPSYLSLYFDYFADSYIVRKHTLQMQTLLNSNRNSALDKFLVQ